MYELFINIKYKFIFIKNEKCASTSIINFFKNNLNINDNIQLNVLTMNNIPIEYIDYFKFTTIRNPYDRLVSLYFHGKPDHNYIKKFQVNYNKSTAFYHSFKNYIIHEITNNNLKCFKIDNVGFNNNIQIINKIYNLNIKYKEHNNSSIFFQSLSDSEKIPVFIEDFNIKTLENDINSFYNNNNLSFDNILKFKHNEHIELSLNTENKSRHNYYLTYYDELLFKLVKNYFSKDIEIGNYNIMFNK